MAHIVIGVKELPDRNPTSRRKESRVKSKNVEERINVSAEMQILADRAAWLRRRDIRAGKKPKEIKVYYKTVLDRAGIPATRDRFRAMGSHIGKRGGEVTAQKLRSGEIIRGKSSGGDVSKPRRFREVFDWATVRLW